MAMVYDDYDTPAVEITATLYCYYIGRSVSTDSTPFFAMSSMFLEEDYLPQVIAEITPSSKYYV